MTVEYISDYEMCFIYLENKVPLNLREFAQSLSWDRLIEYGWAKKFYRKKEY